MKRIDLVGRYLLLLVVGVMIAGCDGWSYSPPLRGNLYSERVTVPQLQAESANPRGTPFNQALAKEYSSFASSLVTRDGDTADGDYFARKGISAAHGNIVPPENDGNWAIVTNWGAQGDNRHLIQELRARLVRDLDGGARDRQPQLAARAQVLYDCFVEHMEQSWWTALNGPCHNDLLAALTQLEGGQVSMPGHEFRVYFEFDKYNLTAEARQILAQVAGDAKKDPNVRIMLVGKADLAGTDAYNMGLSHRRADAVRGELGRLGVANNRVDERWVGKREPPIKTPDGVREPRNRVVEITIK